MAEQEQESGTKRPTPAQVQRELDDLKEQVAKLSSQLTTSTDEDLRDDLRQVKLQLAAIDARTATADIVLDNARRVLERLEADKQRGGKYKWEIENHRFKSRNKEPAKHVFYSDATTEKAALDDFKRRSRVQIDGTDPFKAVKIDPALLEAPTSL